ncbi:MAG: 3-beta hydroxysteroid dehydrogenase, partial [Actinomycetota bacterium]
FSPVGHRAEPENAAIAMAERGVRSSTVRLAPLVHSTLDRHGFTHRLIATARQTGVSAYVADGSNRWPAVHTLDAAHLFRLALESAVAGTRWHAAEDVGLTFRTIAEAIATKLGLPAASITAERASDHFGFLGPFVTTDNPTSSQRTRDLLGWQPTHPGLVADLGEGHYFLPRPNPGY